jgi:ArsR family transcriptional regulator
MAFSKEDIFDQPEAQVARMLKALAHPARWYILRKLIADGPLTAGALATGMPLAKATISQHLSRLRDVGLIVPNSEGPYIRYASIMANLEQLKVLLNALLVELLDKGGIRHHEQVLWPVPTWEGAFSQLFD